MIREAKKEDLEALLELYLYLHEDSIPKHDEHLEKIWNSLLRETVKLRNDLVHYKLQVTDTENYTNKNRIDEHKFKSIMETYNQLVEKLNTLDEKFDEKYLYEIPDDFWNVKY